MDDYIKQLEDQNEELRTMLAAEQSLFRCEWYETYPHHFFLMSKSIVYCELTVSEDNTKGSTTGTITNTRKYNGDIVWNAWRAKTASCHLDIAANTIEEAVIEAKEEVIRLIRSGLIISTLDPRVFK